MCYLPLIVKLCCLPIGNLCAIYYLIKFRNQKSCAITVDSKNVWEHYYVLSILLIDCYLITAGSLHAGTTYIMVLQYAIIYFKYQHYYMCMQLLVIMDIAHFGLTRETQGPMSVVL